MANILLEVNNLQVQFQSYEGTIHAVNGVSFYVKEGETLGIVGESGSGKSVTMLSVMGLVPQPPGKITAGEVLFEGTNLLKADHNRLQNLRGKEIAMIFQDPMTSLNPVLSIGEQISETLTAHKKYSAQEARQESLSLLEMVGIPDPAARFNHYPHQFSGGMRQRVMIAMAISCSPKLLIADEPTTALDVTIQSQILDLVQNLREKKKMSVVWISHDLSIIAELADRVIVMYSGYIIEEADVYSLYRNPLHPYTNALLRSIPRLDAEDGERLAAISGSPPDSIDPISGCPFAARCEFTQDVCTRENPKLVEVTPGHKAACRVDIMTGKLL